jgi:pimeloyl-ACP methyl ester carboxylesterase
VRSAVLGGGAPFTVGSYAKATWFRQLIRQSAQDLEQGRGMGRIVRFLWPPDQPPPAHRQIAEINRQQLAGQDLHALAAVLRQWSEWSVDDRLLAANRVPVLALVGAQDVMKRAVEPLEGRLARMDVVEIARANHLNAAELPELQRQVMKFLDCPREPVVTNSPDRTERVDELVRRQMRRQHIPGLALAVVRDGKLLMAKGCGCADLDR